MAGRSSVAKGAGTATTWLPSSLRSTGPWTGPGSVDSSGARQRLTSPRGHQRRGASTPWRSFFPHAGLRWPAARAGHLPANREHTARARSPKCGTARGPSPAGIPTRPGGRRNRLEGRGECRHGGDEPWTRYEHVGVRSVAGRRGRAAHRPSLSAPWAVESPRALRGPPRAAAQTEQPQDTPALGAAGPGRSWMTGMSVQS